VVLGPKGSFEPVSEPKLKVEPIKKIYSPPSTNNQKKIGTLCAQIQKVSTKGAHGCLKL